MPSPSLYRVFVIGRWGHGPHVMDFYHWMAMMLGQAGPPPVNQLHVAMMPAPEAPDLATWISAIDQMVGDDPAERARTVIVGHSIGALACLHYAALPHATPIAGLLAVAGFLTVDTPWAGLEPWLEAPLDHDAARPNLPNLITLISDDDPHTADHEANAAQWAQRLGAETRIVPGAGHFTEVVQPAVLRGLKDLLGMA